MADPLWAREEENGASRPRLPASILAGLPAPSRGLLGRVGSGIVAPFPLAGEQGGEPLALLGGQAGDEVGEGIGGRFVRVFRFAGGNAGATEGSG